MNMCISGKRRKRAARCVCLAAKMDGFDFRVTLDCNWALHDYGHSPGHMRSFVPVEIECVSNPEFGTKLFQHESGNDQGDEGVVWTNVDMGYVYNEICAWIEELKKEFPAAFNILTRETAGKYDGRYFVKARSGLVRIIGFSVEDGKLLMSVCEYWVPDDGGFGTFDTVYTFGIGEESEEIAAILDDIENGGDYVETSAGEAHRMSCMDYSGKESLCKAMTSFPGTRSGKGGGDGG